MRATRTLSILILSLAATSAMACVGQSCNTAPVNSPTLTGGSPSAVASGQQTNAPNITNEGSSTYGLLDGSIALAPAGYSQTVPGAASAADRCRSVGPTMFSFLWGLIKVVGHSVELGKGCLNVYGVPHNATADGDYFNATSVAPVRTLPQQAY